MIIEKTSNPLLTEITLDDNEKKYLRAHCELWAYKDLLFTLYIKFKDNSVELTSEKIKEFYSEIKENTDEYYSYFLEVLKSHYHMGDCCHLPTTCDKCTAEEFFGINTLPSKDRSENSRIYHETIGA